LIPSRCGHPISPLLVCCGEHASTPQISTWYLQGSGNSCNKSLDPSTTLATSQPHSPRSILPIHNHSSTATEVATACSAVGVLSSTRLRPAAELHQSVAQQVHLEGAIEARLPLISTVKALGALEYFLFHFPHAGPPAPCWPLDLFILTALRMTVLHDVSNSSFDRSWTSTGYSSLITHYKPYPSCRATPFVVIRGIHPSHWFFSAFASLFVPASNSPIGALASSFALFFPFRADRAGVALPRNCHCGVWSFIYRLR